ncbi:ATP-binding protein [Actinosynnema sp. NPDC047251]|uniref:ATP-binding protein n=1 Tax=Saccharothrix espanaensis TaxID=103731 RepID=UPI002F9173DA
MAGRPPAVAGTPCGLHVSPADVEGMFDAAQARTASGRQGTRCATAAGAGHARAGGILDAHRRAVVESTHLVRDEPDLLPARHAVRAAAVAAGLGLIAQTKIVTAASELVRNAYVHGGAGTLVISTVTSPRGRRGLRLSVTDSGPGIPDVPAALADGFGTGTGPGHGLGGARTLVDEFAINTEVGRGTTVTIVQWVT